MTDEAMPAGWLSVAIGELVDVQTGATPLRGNSEFYEGGDIPWVTSGALNEAYITHADEFITDQAIRETNAKVFAEGTLLVAMYGEGKTRGKVSELRIAAATNQACAGLIFDGEVEKCRAYIKWFFVKNYQELRQQASGGVQPNLNLTIIRNAQMPLAPLNEQRRIVDEIEAQFTRLDAGISALKRLEANLKRYKASVLKAACEGDLVPQDPDDEPASELLARILRERREQWEADKLAEYDAKGKKPPKNWQDKYKEPVEPDTDDLPDLPEGWVWASLEQCSWDSGYGTSEKCDYDGSGPPVLRIPNVSGGKLDTGDMKYVVDAVEWDQDQSVSPGDFLIIRTNGSPSLIGRGTLIREAFEQLHFFASYLIRFRLLDVDEMPEWIEVLWDSDHIRQWVKQIARTSAGQYNVNMTNLNNTPIPILPLSYMMEALEELSKATSIIDQVELTLHQTTKRAERLRQSILKEAFAGRLVLQDSSDEPASELMARIRAEREKKS